MKLLNTGKELKYHCANKTCSFDRMIPMKQDKPKLTPHQLKKYDLRNW